MNIQTIATSMQRSVVAPLFDGVEISLAQTFLQGHGGCGWCDNLENPSVAVVECQGLILFGGDSSASCAEEFAAFLPHLNDEYYIFCSEIGWLPLIENAHPNQTRRYTRYSMRCDFAALDRERLRRFIHDVPPEYEIVRIDKEYYRQAMSEDWSRDFCSFFQSDHDFLDRGIGFCAVYQDRIVSGASAFSIYDDGIEIQVETHSKHQRRGLATACSAALILAACLTENRKPCWDAICENSRDLALKLGYEVGQEYAALVVNEANKMFCLS